jgi:hypothetical protein
MRRTLCGKKNSVHSLVKKSLKIGPPVLQSILLDVVQVLHCLVHSQIRLDLAQVLYCLLHSLLVFLRLKKQGINVTAY